MDVTSEPDDMDVQTQPRGSHANGAELLVAHGIILRWSRYLQLCQLQRQPKEVTLKDVRAVTIALAVTIARRQGTRRTSQCRACRHHLTRLVRRHLDRCGTIRGTIRKRNILRSQSSIHTLLDPCPSSACSTLDLFSSKR
eukprot:2590154-Prymnesium_polylepis.2